MSRLLYGVVACGGKSSRMGIDKSMLTYHDKPQRYHIAELLKKYCNRVLISINNEQDYGNEYDYVIDNPLYANQGPLTGLLSVYSLYPQVNVLLIGCDYPFLCSSDINNLITKSMNRLTAMYNNESELYEPTIAFYPSSSLSYLYSHYDKIKSLQSFLRSMEAEKIPGSETSIKSIDTLPDFNESKIIIKQSKKDYGGL